MRKVADKVKSELKVFSRTLEKHWTGENIPPQSQPVMVELKGNLPGVESYYVLTYMMQTDIQ